MKKFRVIMALLMVLSILMLCACDSTTPSTGDQSGSESSSVTKDDDTSKDTSVTRTVFEQFEDALEDKNITFQKVTMGAELVGAEQGVKYKLQNENVEIYRFDTSSDAYVEAENTQSLKMEGFGAFEATVVNGYAIVSDNAELINIFTSIVSK